MFSFQKQCRSRRCPALCSTTPPSPQLFDPLHNPVSSTSPALALEHSTLHQQTWSRRSISIASGRAPRSRSTPRATSPAPAALKVRLFDFSCPVLEFNLTWTCCIAFIVTETSHANPTQSKPAGSTSSSSTMSLPRRPRTSVLSAPARRASATRDQASIA